MLEEETTELAQDAYDVVASWLAHKDPVPEGWKGKMRPIGPMACAEIQKLGKKGCSKLLSRARRSMLRLKSLSATLSALASAVQAESEAAQTNLEVVSNMCGLASLPNELLVRVLECVVNEDSSLKNPTRWKTAVSLSHVCQYFRETALSCSKIWASISGSGIIASSCLSRSKDVPLDVELAVGFGSVADPRELLFEQLFLESLPHSKRWRRLDIQIVFARDDVSLNRTSVGGSDIRQAFRVVDAPQLDSLHIRNVNYLDLDIWDDDVHSLNVLYKSYNEFAHWNTPNIRRLTTVYYFPLSLPDLAGVTTLDITLLLNQINFADLLKDLSRMKNLEDFTLKLDLDGNKFQEYNHIQLNVRTELPSVRRLRIETKAGYRRRRLWRSLFSCTFFPGAIDLHVGLRGILEKEYPNPDFVDWEDCASLNLEDEVMHIFWNVEQFPCVERFHLGFHGICDADVNTSSWFESYEGYIKVFIPLNVLPSMKHFTLKSNRRLQVSRGWDPPGATLPALETITVQIPAEHPEGVTEWIREFLRKQKERGERELFRELVRIIIHEDGPADNRSEEKVTERYVGDAAWEWCED